MFTRHIPLEKRFWARVEKRGPSECWLWTAATNGVGYGTIFSGGERAGRMVLAHRLSFEIHKGTIPKGHYVCHHCDNPRCVNPEHLFAGTPRENTQDMFAKGRWSAAPIRGAAQAQAKLSDDQVREIRARIGRVPLRDIAAEFGVSKSLVWNIKAGLNWTHVQ
jgi:hypothetical protein